MWSRGAVTWSLGVVFDPRTCSLMYVSLTSGGNEKRHQAERGRHTVYEVQVGQSFQPILRRGLR